MRRSAVVSGMLLALAGINGCTPAFLGPAERGKICRVAVEEQFEAIEVQANPVANPAGGALAGAGSAALVALGVLALNPLGVLQGVVGAAGSVACAAAAAAHPNAEAEFREIVMTADRGALTRALEAAMPSPGAGCRNGPERAPEPPDTVIRIDRVQLMMGCPTGRQAYFMTVEWRAMSASGRKVLAESKTRCTQISPLDADVWSADPERARAEVNGALARTGQRIAAELLGADKWSSCTFRPEEPRAAGPP